MNRLKQFAVILLIAVMAIGPDELALAQQTPQYLKKASPTFTGSMSGPTLNSSVNTWINVMASPYNAKGDCSTDDEPAVAAAQTAALAFSLGSQSTAVLYFPKAPGGCYLFNTTFQWLGVPLIGQPAGLANLNAGGVSIKGAATKDIIHVADPNVSAINFHSDWVIRDITLLVNDTSSTVGLFPHRWPGRWFDTVSMTNGSTTLTDTSGRGRIGCGDVGQAIRVVGAGVAGADLVTTIASADPCWAGAVAISSAQKVVLAAAASTTVTNAHTYISVNGYSTTYTMGNAAIAFDNYDGNTAHWINPSQKTVQTYAGITNVAIGTTDNGQANDSVGIFVQGSWSWYGTFVDHVNIQRIVWPMAQVCSELSSYTGNCMNDMQRWTHMKVNGTNAFLTYDGLLTHYTDIQFDTQKGPQYLALGVIGEYSPDQMKQDNVEFENASTVYGTRYTGQSGWFNGVDLAPNSSVAYFDSADTYCRCNWTSLQAGGYGNKFESNADESLATTTDVGKNNTFVAKYLASPSLSNPPSLAYSITKASLLNRTAGLWNADFLVDGNLSTPYNRFDFMIMPGDWIYNFGSSGLLSGFDAASPTGQYIDLPSLFNNGSFNQFTYTGAKNGRIAPGVNFPTTGLTVYFSAKCVTGSAFTLELHGFVAGVDTNVLGTTGSASCNTTYQNYTMRATGALAGNDYLTIKNPNAQVVRLAWMYFAPDRGGSSTPVLAAALTTTAATTDNVTVTNMTSSGHCSLTPTNASAATNVATTYVSAKTTNQITVTHTATASMTYDVNCTAY